MSSATEGSIGMFVILLIATASESLYVSDNAQAWMKCIGTLSIWYLIGLGYKVLQPVTDNHYSHICSF